MGGRHHRVVRAANLARAGLDQARGITLGIEFLEPALQENEQGRNLRWAEKDEIHQVRTSGAARQVTSSGMPPFGRNVTRDTGVGSWPATGPNTAPDTNAASIAVASSMANAAPMQ